MILNQTNFKSKSIRTINFIKNIKRIVLIHHDLIKNIIFNNKEIKIIDWEYAGINDIF